MQGDRMNEQAERWPVAAPFMTHCQAPQEPNDGKLTSLREVLHGWHCSGNVIRVEYVLIVVHVREAMPGACYLTLQSDLAIRSISCCFRLQASVGDVLIKYCHPMSKWILEAKTQSKGKFPSPGTKLICKHAPKWTWFSLDVYVIIITSVKIVLKSDCWTQPFSLKNWMLTRFFPEKACEYNKTEPSILFSFFLSKFPRMSLQVFGPYAASVSWVSHATLCGQLPLVISCQDKKITNKYYFATTNQHPSLQRWYFQMTCRELKMKSLQMWNHHG